MAVILFSAPEAVLVDDMMILEEESNNAHLQWEKPMIANGPISRYDIYITFWNDTHMNTSQVSTSETETTVFVSCKDWGPVNMSFTVSAVNVEQGQEMTGPASLPTSRLMCEVNVICKYTVTVTT